MRVDCHSLTRTFFERPAWLRQELPRWHRLHQFLSERDVPMEAAAELSAVDPKLRSLLAGPQSRLDLLALIFLRKLEDRGLPVDCFTGDRFPEFRLTEELWCALPHVLVDGKAYLATDFDKTISQPYPERGSDLAPGEFELDLMPAFEAAFAAWRKLGLNVERGADGWTVHIEGQGYLQLESLDTLGSNERHPDAYTDGYKAVSPDNFADLDPTIEGNSKAAAKEEIREILSLTLGSEVPQDIRRMFQFIRNSAVYGFLYRPIFTLMKDELWLLRDAALYQKCLQLGEETRAKGMGYRVEYLVKKGVIEADERGVWDAARNLRNSTAHRTQQRMWQAGCYGALRAAMQDINRLFRPEFASQPPRRAGAAEPAAVR
jgi:hypothetical protein